MITIIIYSYKRQEYLKRQIEYWSNYINFDVIICDGSDRSLEFEYTLNIGMNVKYIHYPKDIFERINKLLFEIKGNYVCILPDDEFYLPSSLIDCADFLENNKDYTTCMGVSLGYAKYKGDIYFREQYHIESHQNDDKDKFKRVIKHLRNYKPNSYYAVWRKHDFIEAFEIMLINKYNYTALYEFIVEIYANFLGKTKILKTLTWFRNLGENSHFSNIKKNKCNIWYENNPVEIMNFMNNIKKIISLYDKKEYTDKYNNEIMSNVIRFMSFKEKKSVSNKFIKYLKTNKIVAKLRYLLFKYKYKKIEDWEYYFQINDIKYSKKEIEYVLKMIIEYDKDVEITKIVPKLKSNINTNV